MRLKQSLPYSLDVKDRTTKYLYHQIYNQHQDKHEYQSPKANMQCSFWWIIAVIVKEKKAIREMLSCEDFKMNYNGK